MRSTISTSPLSSRRMLLSVADDEEGKYWCHYAKICGCKHLSPPSNRSTDINIVNLVLVIKTKTRDLNMAGFVYVGQVGVSEISVLCELEYSTAAI